MTAGGGVNGDFLNRMATMSRDRVGAARAREPLAALTRRADATPQPLRVALQGFDLIAELKLRSPAAGALATAEFDPAPQLDAYVAGGAAAVSVLTEPEAFNGDLAHLENAALRLRPSACPVMRKDFLVDPYQAVEARASGASGVLVIARLVDDTALDELVAAAQELGLFILLEAFDYADLERIGALSFTAASQIFVGINSRNLRTLDVDFGRFAELIDRVPAGVPAVAESGIDDADAIAQVARAGYRLALVGSALMREADVEGAVARFVAAGRAAAGEDEPCS